MDALFYQLTAVSSFGLGNRNCCQLATSLALSVSPPPLHSRPFPHSRRRIEAWQGGGKREQGKGKGPRLG